MTLDSGKPLRYDDRMPRALHVTLVRFLQNAMHSPKDCRGDLSRTTVFLDRRIPNVDGALAWLKEHGGHCDCEVIMNTVPWSEIKQPPVH